MSELGYFSQSTIVALATPVGGALAIIRMSGPKALSFWESLTRFKFDPKKAGKLLSTPLYDTASMKIDDALSVYFCAPLTFTGEDLVEFHIHGSGLIAQSLLQSLIHLGARQALPGEFSFRRVRSGKMTLFQAEAISEVISASSPPALSLALEKMSGLQNHLLSSLRDDLKRLAALGEIGIDFSDQDVEEVSLPHLKKRLKPIQNLIQAFIDSYSRGSLLSEGIRVAIVGLPNAGKSSFFNCLLGEDRSIVSNQAGTTRDVVRETVHLQGITFRIEDTAGLRVTTEQVEKEGIDRSFRSSKTADLILLVVNPNQSLKELENQWRSVSALRKDAHLRTLGVLTHADQYPAQDSKMQETIQFLHSLSISSTFPISSFSSPEMDFDIESGVKILIQHMVDVASFQLKRQPGEFILTRLDHLQASKDALDHLNRAEFSPEIDLFASDLRQALSSLSPLIGETLADDLLTEIFSKFCIGK